MPDVRYSVAVSLDGFIAGPNGEFDWITIDPDIDFTEMYAGFSGLLMGRHSYDVYSATGGGEGAPLPTYVYSRSPTPGPRVPLRLKTQRVYPKTGTLSLEYDVVAPARV